MLVLFETHSPPTLLRKDWVPLSKRYFHADLQIPALIKECIKGNLEHPDAAMDLFNCNPLNIWYVLYPKKKHF